MKAVLSHVFPIFDEAENLWSGHVKAMYVGLHFTRPRTVRANRGRTQAPRGVDFRRSEAKRSFRINKKQRKRSQNEAKRTQSNPNGPNRARARRYASVLR